MFASMMSVGTKRYRDSCKSVSVWLTRGGAGCSTMFSNGVG